MALGLKEIASGDKQDLSQLADYENRFDEGDEGVLDLRLSFVPPGTDTALAGMAVGLRRVGVVLPQDPEILGNTIRIHFKKALAPLALILGAVAAFILLALVSWSLFTKDPGIFGLPKWTWGLLAAGLILVVLLVVGLGLAMGAQRGIEARVTRAVGG